MAQYMRSDLQPDSQYGGFKDREITDWPADVSQVNFGQMLQNPSSALSGFGDGSNMRAYDPSPRERLAGWLTGDNPSIGRRGLVSGLLGSSGLGTGFGLLDLTPGGIPFAVHEAIRARDPQAAVLAIIPGGATAGRAAMKAGEMAAERAIVSGARGLHDIGSASSVTSGYDAPKLPQRSFEADYPKGAAGEPGSQLGFDSKGRQLTAGLLVGRHLVGGGDTPLLSPELAPAATRITGSPPQAVEARALPPRAIGVFRESRGTDGPERTISILKTLDQASADRVLAHELGHAIDAMSRIYPADGIPLDGIRTELKNLYHVMNTGQDVPKYPRQLVGPESFGYKTPADIDREYMAEAIRTYLTNPNYIKTVAPKTAARIRDAVNPNPRLNKIIQFNSAVPVAGAAGVGAAGLAAAPDGDEE